VVCVFARTIDGNLTSLVKAIDKAVEKNASKRLCAFVVILTDDADSTAQKLTKLAEEHNIDHVPLTLVEGPGPKSYNLNPEAEVTILLWKNTRVVKNFAYDSTSDLTPKTIEKIVDAAESMVR